MNHRDSELGMPMGITLGTTFDCGILDDFHQQVKKFVAQDLV